MLVYLKHGFAYIRIHFLNIHHVFPVLSYQREGKGRRHANSKASMSNLCPAGEACKRERRQKHACVPTGFSELTCLL